VPIRLGIIFLSLIKMYTMSAPKKQPVAPAEIPNPHPVPDMDPNEAPDDPVVTPEKPVKNPGVPAPDAPPGIQPPTTKPEPEVPATA
jgi:hypothetical protein